MIRAVLDTNVLASGIVGTPLPTSIPGELLRLWRRQRYQLIVSHHVLAELQRTLAKPYFSARMTPIQSSQALDLLQLQAIMTAITVDVSGVTAHPEDDLVLAAAISASADYVVTGDAKFQAVVRFGGVEIASPRAFLQLLAQSAF